MGKGRVFSRALKSRVTPTGRWAPGPNARARCMGNKLSGKTGGGRAGVRTRFVEASGGCKVRGK